MENFENTVVLFATGRLEYSVFHNLALSIDSQYFLEKLPVSMAAELASEWNPDIYKQLRIRGTIRDWCKNSSSTAKLLTHLQHSTFECVKQKVYKAFESISLDQGLTLEQAQAIDNYRSVEDQLIARKKDISITWQLYPSDRLEKFTALLQLDSKGFIYYIPAYLAWCLDNCLDDEYSNIALETFGVIEQELRKPKSRLLTLDKQQTAAIMDFLWLFAIFSETFRESCVSSLSNICSINLLTYKINC